MLLIFEVKASQTTERNSILFPTSGVAFLVYSIADLFVELPQSGSKEQSCTPDEQLLLRIRNFSSGKFAVPTVYNNFFY